LVNNALEVSCVITKGTSAREAGVKGPTPVFSDIHWWTKIIIWIRPELQKRVSFSDLTLLAG